MKRIVWRACGLAALAGAIASAWAAGAEARPVSYPGGWTVIQENDLAANAALVHYSPSARYSVGLRVEDRRLQPGTFVGPQVNVLLKRWNRPDAQANLYLKTAAGALVGLDSPDGDDEAAAGFATLAGDWENRRLFVSYAARGFAQDGAGDRFHQQARAGIAPYVAEFGGLHLWTMVQIDHRPGTEDALTATPLIRAFKGSFLGELGWTTSGWVLANWIYRF